MLKMVSRLPGENNNSYAYRAIKEGIVSLSLLPGQLLSLGELTEALNVSSTPIKIAIWKLQQEHLVDVIPQVGSYVSRINLELVEEAAYMWFDLEKEYLKSACHSFSEDHMNQLKMNLILQETLLGQKEIMNQKELARKFNELDEQFHSIIFHAHHRINTWKAISHMTLDYHRMISFSQHPFEQMIAEHKEIVSIIENMEKERVEGVLKNHIFKPIEDWRNVYKEEVF